MGLLRRANHGRPIARILVGSQRNLASRSPQSPPLFTMGGATTVDPTIARMTEQDTTPWYKKPNLRMLYLLMFPTCIGIEMTSGWVWKELCQDTGTQRDFPDLIRL